MKKNNGLDLLLFVLFVNIFFFHAFGTVALSLLLMGVWILIQRIFGRVEKGASLLLGLTIGALFFVNSPEKIMLLSVQALAIFFVQTYRLLKKDELGGILELSLSGLYVVREYLRSGLLLAASVIKGNLRQVFHFEPLPRQRSPWLRSVMAGVLVGLPLIAWLTYTLTQADPIFASYIKNVLSEEFLNELPGRFVFSVLTLLFLLPTLLMSYRGYISPLAWLTRMRWGREMAIVTGMVALVLAVFLCVQWPYVFVNVAKETDLSAYGVATYSEYVTRGFWDLLKVVVMVLGVAWAGALISKGQPARERKMLLFVQGVLGLEFVIFIVSIFRRVWLYQHYHGLTLARLYGLVLLIMIVGMVVTMALRYLYPKVRWMRIEAGWLVVMVFATILLNMEALVVKDPPTVNNRVDYVYLSRLSGDGKEGWKMAYAWANQVLTEQSNAANPNGHMKFVEKDERRDIFYAGLIAKNLADDYRKLIIQFGNEVELKDYYRQVILSQVDVWQWWAGQDKARNLSELNDHLKNLDSKDWASKVRVTQSPTVGNFTRTSYEYAANVWPDFFFTVFKTSNSDYLTGIDKVLAYNPSGDKMYLWMRGNIPLEKILELQNKYVALQGKISHQPDGSRDVDVDISLASPFLR